MRLAGLAFFPLVALVARGWGAEQWKAVYFYDENKASFTINDLCFPSPERGVAVGVLERRGKTKPYSVITTDGGARWIPVPLSEPGISLYFLNEGLGWMVTPNGIWRTDEVGRSWRKLARLPEIRRVCFVDDRHGWAVGNSKAFYETQDGGAHWNKVKSVELPNLNAQSTHFTWVDFLNPKTGIVTGFNRPPRLRESPVPDFLDPETASKRRQWPSLSVSIETKDSGQTWKASVASLFGAISRVRLSSAGFGLGLVEFFDAFDWPSEVFLLDLRTGASSRAFRERSRHVTDVQFLSGRGLLAAVDTPGQMHRSPIPGRLRILTSSDLKVWQEMPVDYRAVARRAVLAVAGERRAWAATDTGMILRLVSSDSK